MANRKNTFLLKRSNVVGKIPAAGDLQLGELALNTADNILYASGTTANSILPIGWDRVARTGDTMTGTLFAPSISATTISAETITLKNYIDFNTGTTTPTNVSGRVFYDNQTHSLAYFPDINQNVKVEVGQQLYIRGYNNTGSIIPKGTVLSIQSATNGLPNFTPTVILHYTNSQVVGLAASDIPINGNGLALSQGILSGITINSFNIGDILYASPFSAGTYVANTSTFPFSARTNQIGYVIATGTSTGEIYVNINNEDENLTLTDIERNILEGNVISTGTYEFTGMTVASTTTFNIAPMRGFLVKNTYEYATLPDVINLFYTGGTNISVTNIASADSTYVLITSALTVTQQTTFPTPQQRRENIYLGKVNHPNRTSILNINNTADYDVSPMSALRDLWSPIKYINQGIIPSPNGANLSFNTSAGTLWGNGINWHNNQLNPNSVSISGKTPASFFYRTQTGGTSSSVTVIDPTKYDIGGVITSISPAGSNDATNQRIYLYPTGVINVLYGQTRYTTLAAAIAAIQSETFIPYPNAESTGILIGVISVRNDIVADGQPLTNTDYAKFTLVSKFGESFGGTGGLSTTTLQQAYNNSTNPEIVINATLDGLSIQNGTGNADNTTHLLEGLNTAGNTTSFIRADGYISGTTFQSNGFIANNNGISATTVSATTYFNLPLDIRVTGGTYSSSTGAATYTNTTGGTFNVTGFFKPTDDIYTTGLTFNASNYNLSITRNDGTSYSQSLAILASDMTITGGTYSSSTGVATFTNNTGGTFSVSGFLTGMTDTYTTGFTYSNNSFTLKRNASQPDLSVLVNTMTGLTINGDLIVSGNTQSWFSGDSSSDLVKITQTGSGNALVVEDANNPDFTQFVINNSGDVGIGTNTPAAKLHISNTATTINAGLYTSDFVIVTAEDTAPGFNIISAGNSFGNRGVFKATRSRGTLNSPLVPQSGDFTFSLLGAVYDGVTNFATAGISFEVDGSVTANTAPQRITFLTGTGSTRFERLRVTSSGDIGIGTNTPEAKLHVSGNTLISGNLTTNTISATTYLNLPIGVYVTGGTYAAGTATFTNNTGGTFSVTGFSTGSTSSVGGKWGIANSGGTYTYYTTYQLAVAAATSGQTIEMFGSQTESTANHTLKNGVNINYNGYTLTFGGLFRLDDNNVACDVQLLNGEIKQPTTNGFCILVANSGTVIRGNVLVNSSGTNSYGLYGPATVIGLQFKGSYCLTLYSAGAKGKAYGVTINCTSNIAYAWGEIYNSVINSTSTNGRALQYVTNVVNCSGIHNGFVSVYCDGVNMRNCSFTNLTSDILAFVTQDNNFFDSCYFRCAGNTLGNGPGNGKNLMTNCKISTFSYSYAFGSAVINMDNCTIISDTSYTFNQPAAGKFNKCTFIVRDGSNSFHEPATGVIKLNNCDFQLFNASAYPVYAGSAKNFTASNNTYNTTNFQLNMTNLQTYTADAYGNQRLN